MNRKTSRDAAAEAMESGNVDKIREIIFGAQMRDYEKRFAALESRLLKESSALRDEVAGRLDALERFIKQEVADVREALASEASERESECRGLARDIEKLDAAAEKKRTQLQEKLSKGQRELREALLEQSKALGEDIRRAREEMVAALEAATEELRGDKADRQALAAMFTEMAMRLNDEFALPGGDAEQG